ncbi:type II secretion system F family protein [Clostridium tunisiense]|uniref:type II secretion system F family protein n=1 Tax=Clostridium tunisiense TaxID=219748 RepID=UPI0002FF367B|nr:type II secretion system F family protein [Clostridium tunisiense]
MQYKYVATNIDGNYVRGNKIAKNPEELVKLLKGEKLFCISYRKTIEFELMNFTKRTSHKDIALFCKYMSTSLKGGMNICDILNLICYQFKNKSLSKGLNNIKENIQIGNTFSETLEKFPMVFPPFFREMVYIGEESGNLQEIFYNMENYYSSNYKRTKKLISSLVYPAFTLFLTIVITFFMITQILPKFMIHIIDLKGELPAITKFYLNMGSFLNKYGLVFMLAIILTFTGAYYTLKKIHMKDFSFILVKFPFISFIYKKVFYARFSYSMYMLLGSGIDIISALNIIIKCERKQFFSEGIKKASKSIEEGKSIYEAFNSTGIFPKFFIAMVHIGEENGTLDNMLNTANEIFEQDLSGALERLSVLIEPILILILGGIVGTIVLAIMMPMIKLSTGGI